MCVFLVMLLLYMFVMFVCFVWKALFPFYCDQCNVLCTLYNKDKKNKNKDTVHYTNEDGANADLGTCVGQTLPVISSRSVAQGVDFKPSLFFDMTLFGDEARLTLLSFGQCRAQRSGVVRHNLGRLKTSRAAARWISCRGRHMQAQQPGASCGSLGPR